MKTFHWLGLILLVCCVGVLLSTLNKTATYADFTEAESHPDKEFHVVGKWNREKGVIYRPEADPNHVEFFMTDIRGQERAVILLRPMPPDFDKSEQMVLIGKMKGKVFYASDILLKCPSKYNDPAITSAENSNP